MERRFSPEDAAALYRMLWGYTNKDLEDGADRKLVQYLDHDKLAFRVLAFWNLKDITGMKLYYQPEQTAAQRRRWVTEWKRYREQGKVRIRGGEEKPRGSQEKPRSCQEKLRGSEAPPVSPTPPPTETNGGNHNETGKDPFPRRRPRPNRRSPEGEGDLFRPPPQTCPRRTRHACIARHRAVPSG